MKRTVDYIIVGQGLAGTVLSYSLYCAGVSHVVVNHTNPQKSSWIGAGLYNPITGRKMVKTWNADKLFPAIQPFYNAMEALLSQQFLFPTGIYRPFFSNEERNDWQGKAADAGFKPFISQVHSTSIKNQNIVDPFGGLMLNQAGYLDIAGLIDRYNLWLKNKGIYLEALLKQEDLSMNDTGVTYNGISAKALIFCEGIPETSQPFSWLPFSPVKGELMEVKAEVDFDFILNRGVFMVPLGNGIFRLGATYKRETELTFDQQSEAELKEKLSQILNAEITVVNRKVGMRPATKDRRPLIGRHPKEKKFYIFNGLGSKGVSLAPYYAQQFVNFLLAQQSLDESVDVERYYSHYDEKSDGI